VSEAEQVAEQMRLGDRARRARRWADAEAAYRLAWEKSGSATAAGDLGLAELELGKTRDAAAHLSLSVSGELTAAFRRAAEKGLAKALKEVAVLVVTVSEPGAEVSLDGERVGVSPLDRSIFLGPGEHTLKATLAGYEDATATITAEKGGSPEATLYMRPKPKVSPAPERKFIAPAQEPKDQSARYMAVGGFSLTAMFLGAAIGETVAANQASADARAINTQLRGAAGLDACLDPQIDPPQCDLLRDRVRDQVRHTDGAAMLFATVSVTAGISIAMTLLGSDGWPWRPVLTGRRNGLTLVGAW